ncbi:MAG: flagellar biosynthesis protein FlhB [Clostridium sp.]|nr:flagellar biosynthesis protein FlhB [Acetatifactor muris]MCM1525999.1 flagellar biosynthesis protein FlhB [Bacteroides sp.]MCM1562241.1 flagellar biosynthesis protein FlhB [Clostridium sp.]
MLLEYNLQFFAKEGPGGEKTEPATEKKLTDARKEGQVAKSREIANGLGILALFLVLRFWVGTMGTQLMDVFTNVYGRINDTVVFWQGNLPQNDIRVMFHYMMIRVVIIIAPVLLIGFLIAFICDAAQVKWRPTGKPLQPKFNKLNPISGFKKIISVNSLVELVKAILKIGLIVYICYNYLKDKWRLLFLLYDISLLQALQLVATTVTDLGIRIAAVYMIIAFADYAYQKVKFARDMRMTKQEVKDEYKQSEGDPKVKAKIRQRMMAASQRRMMQDLPKADVVITNPTHYAVAIKYDPDVADAPLVIAKGEDYLAAKIKEIARENRIEIVENKPLARMLYANVEVGQMVPPELYQAVAEVLAFVYHLQGKV